MENQDILVSIIIPCYNVDVLIEECLESAFSQTYPLIEVICVDNASTDKTLQTLYDLKSTRFENLIVLSELKRGASAARNRGLAVARGSWIQFLDADDLLFCNKIFRQVDLLKKGGGDFDLVIGTSIRRSLDGQMYPNTIEADRYLAPFIGEWGNTSSNLWSAKKLRELGGWDELLSSSQETELLLRMALGNINFVCDFSYQALIRERNFGQISQSHPKKRAILRLEVRLDYLSKLRQLESDAYEINRETFLLFLLSTVIFLGRFDRYRALVYYRRLKLKEVKSYGKFGITIGKFIWIKILGFKSYLILLKCLSTGRSRYRRPFS